MRSVLLFRNKIVSLFNFFKEEDVPSGVRKEGNEGGFEKVMVKIDFTKTELNVLHWAVKIQLDRLLQAKKEGHNVDEDTMLPILKRLKEKTFVKKEEGEIRVVT